MALKKTSSKKDLPKAQTGTSNKKRSTSLNEAELKALAHQFRGMPAITPNESFVKKAGSIKNELGRLTSDQTKQLQNYMGKSSTLKKLYEALPNVGRMIGNSAADIPKGSILEKQKKGGSVKSKITVTKTKKK